MQTVHRVIQKSQFSPYQILPPILQQPLPLHPSQTPDEARSAILPIPHNIPPESQMLNNRSQSTYYMIKGEGGKRDIDHLELGHIKIDSMTLRVAGRGDVTIRTEQRPLALKAFTRDLSQNIHRINHGIKHGWIAPSLRPRHKSTSLSLCTDKHTEPTSSQLHICRSALHITYR